MTRPFKQDAVRDTYSFVDIIPINVTGGDYEISGPDGDHFRGFSIGTAGDVVIRTLTGQERTIPSNCLAVGVFHPIGGVAILQTGTTAAEICIGL